MVNYYKVLKISPKASAAEIKSAYRRLAREMHPDVNSNQEKATKDFALIAKAYEILSNEQERAYFDRQLKKTESRRAIHDTDSVFASDNPHARRIRQMAFERRYNDIIDRMMETQRNETIALQKVVFPTVALFVSTCIVGIFKPLLWTNSRVIGKIVLLTLFVVGMLHLIKRLRSGFERYTYDAENLHNSILEDFEPETKPYSRAKAITFLVVGIGLSLSIGLLIGSLLQPSIIAFMPKFFSATIKPEIIFYPPIIVLLVDAMHLVASKLEH